MGNLTQKQESYNLIRINLRLRLKQTKIKKNKQLFNKQLEDGEIVDIDISMY